MKGIAVSSRHAIFAVLSLLVLSLPAMARPRDEVMAGAFRCAAVGDQRTWLDCFYGAAQPARAALGLPPAPAAQTRLAAAPPAGNAAPADLQLRDQVMAGAFRCAGLDERPWLNCYYAAAAPVRAQLGLSPASQAVPPIPAPPPSFGLPRKPPPVIPGDADHIVAGMAAYSFDKLGWFTVNLDNGQVWAQVHGDTDYAHWKKPPASYQVRVSKGFLNSFNLQVKGEPGKFKVLRQR